MRYLSVCSGIEAATVAWHDLGWEAAAYSEIEKFPSEVLKYHYPSVPNMGDMTKYKEWEIGTIGLLVGGTPCQSFSVAGLRKGLEDPRGNLALTYVGILDKFRPKWFIWENVPGVLSSGKGRDFGAFLGAVAQLGYGFSYRVLDAQHFGVAQRRRRVFVVGHLGDWRHTAKVLFEYESLCRDTKESRKPRKEIAKCLTTSIRNDFASETLLEVPAFWNGSQIAETLTCTSNNQRMPDKNKMQMIVEAHAFKMRGGCDGGGKGYLGKDEQAFTLSCNQDQQIYHQMSVRRLTEVECERLQGFPDNYTNIKENCPSGARYKALGNSMAVPVMKWIGKRIQMVEDGLI
jgi:DNA (cytosine-5)-methyltransferase 1